MTHSFAIVKISNTSFGIPTCLAVWIRNHEATIVNLKMLCCLFSDCKSGKAKQIQKPPCSSLGNLLNFCRLQDKHGLHLRSLHTDLFKNAPFSSQMRLIKELYQSALYRSNISTEMASTVNARHLETIKRWQVAQEDREFNKVRLEGIKKRLEVLAEEVKAIRKSKVSR